MYIPKSIIHFSWILCSVCCRVVISRTTRYTSYPSRVGAGTTLQNLTDVPVLSCSRACSREERCNAATYIPGNQTCSLLQDGVSGWEETEEGLYLGPSSEVGLWPFVGKTSNVLEPLWPTQGYGITYELANAKYKASPRVLTFHGNINSYLLLTNTGGLRLTSFTWAARVVCSKFRMGPLFAWISDDLTYRRFATQIFLHHKGQLYLSVRHDGVGHDQSNTLTSDVSVVENAWSTVAVSYDAVNGAAQVYVDGVVKSTILKVTGAHSTYGVVVLGSRYHFSPPDSRDSRSFSGKIACMRLWSEASDLGTMLLTTQLCSNI